MEAAYLLGTGGAIGAILRHLVYQAIPAEEFPVATLVVNGLGSFLLGLVAFGGLGDDAVLFFGVGLCGAFTTYSTFSVETVQLWESDDRARAIANAVANLAVALAGIAIAGALV